ncbi:MAG: hypothetical protein SRB2_02503 [Desulfobacteraceae bacterium Eth-SRB2]|nr:MAG: hypothetical protein SRB2_02503 [Desulfobacteraceae bacterium Eth-SRB2]
MILTTGIHGVFRGLKFEPDAEIGQKGAFCKGLFSSANRTHLSRNPDRMITRQIVSQRF